MAELEDSVPRDVYARMIRLRRALHEHPELSGEEQATAERITFELESLGIATRTGVGGHGIVADLPGEAHGPFVALRVDMDALPIEEETGLSFSSRIPGKMHACGHDGHASMLLGAAELLQRRPPPSPIRLIWQPAEETAAGAEAMIADRVLDNVALIFGGHVDRHYPPGLMAISDGPVNAATDTFTIEIEGRGGHAGRPHEALDAVVAGSLLVTSLQTIVSREVDPARPSVVSVGRFQAGSAPNVIAGKARLEGTIRSQHRDVQLHLHGAIERIATSVGQLHGAEVRVNIEHKTPVLNNTAPMAALAREAALLALGPGSVTELRTANMGGEDFARFLDHVPGCYIRFGSRIPGLADQPAHSSRFDFDERAIAAGAAWFEQVARRAGQHLGSDSSGGARASVEDSGR